MRSSCGLEVAWRPELARIALGMGLGDGKRARTLLDRDSASVMLETLLQLLPMYAEDEESAAVFEEVIHPALDRAIEETGIAWHPRRRRIGLHLVIGNRCWWAFLEHSAAIVLTDELTRFLPRYREHLDAVSPVPAARAEPIHESARTKV